MSHISPSILDPDHINRVVVIQVFDRLPADPMTLDRTTLRKYVGILEGYSISEVSNRTIIKLAGLTPIVTEAKQHYVELYLISR